MAKVRPRRRPKPKPRRQLPPQGSSYDPLAPLSPSELQAMAAARVEAELAPMRMAIEEERRNSRLMAQARARDISGYAAAGAQMLTGIAPNIQKAYSSAAGETSSFGKGFADATALVAAQHGNEAAAQLEQNGAPQGQVDAVRGAAGGTGMHDVIYGLGGFLPAEGLEREGAAFTAAASMLPAREIGRGAQARLRAGAEADAADREFGRQVLDLEAKRPGAYNSILDSLLQNEREKAATSIQREYLGIAKTKVKLTAADKAAQAGLDASVVDEQLSASNGYLTNKYGQPVLQGGKRVTYTPYVKPSTAGKSGAGARANKTAIASARAAGRGELKNYIGQPVKNPRPGRYTKKGTYLAKPGQSEFNDGTTNDPHRAQISGRASWKEAYNTVYSVIAPDLRDRGLTEKQINKEVVNILRGYNFTKPKPAPRRVQTTAGHR